jgi:hypothetical protein
MEFTLALNAWVAGPIWPPNRDVGLLNASSCDQLFGELSKGSSYGGSGILVSTFFAHALAPWLSPLLDDQHTRVARNEPFWVASLYGLQVRYGSKADINL